MSSSFGNKIKISIFGQSHSKAIGVVIDGLPAGQKLDFEEILKFMARRAPGNNEFSTKRKEADFPIVLSGLVDNTTCGAPLCVMIENNDTRSNDYKNIENTPRPSHADFSAFVKYSGFNDIRGGGHFSGRLTAPICFAGAVCMQILNKQGIFIGSHISSISDVNDDRFNLNNMTNDFFQSLNDKPLSVINDIKGMIMAEKIDNARKECDSVGGVIECCAINFPAGIGEPMFDGIENRLAMTAFGIPAVKGVEFGAGFDGSKLSGKQNNDEFFFDENNVVKTKTNNHGGILGGISTGMPIIMRVAFKPTPSISQSQNTIDLKQKSNTTLLINGRHDPCIVPRALPCVESIMAITLLDFLLG